MHTVFFNVTVVDGDAHENDVGVDESPTDNEKDPFANMDWI